MPLVQWLIYFITPLVPLCTKDIASIIALTDVDYSGSPNLFDKIYTKSRGCPNQRNSKSLQGSLGTAGLEGRQRAGNVVGVSLEVLKNVFDTVDKPVSSIIPHLSLRFSSLKSPRRGQGRTGTMFIKSWTFPSGTFFIYTRFLDDAKISSSPKV